MLKTLQALKTKPRNKASAAFWEALQGTDYRLIKAPWPDFLCVDRAGESVCLVEVKRKRGHRIKRNQLALLEFFASKGIDCYRWAPDGGFEKISPKKASL